MPAGDSGQVITSLSVSVYFSVQCGRTVLTSRVYCEHLNNMSQGSRKKREREWWWESSYYCHVLCNRKPDSPHYLCSFYPITIGMPRKDLHSQNAPSWCLILAASFPEPRLPPSSGSLGPLHMLGSWKELYHWCSGYLRAVWTVSHCEESHCRHRALLKSGAYQQFHWQSHLSFPSERCCNRTESQPLHAHQALSPHLRMDIRFTFPGTWSFPGWFSRDR